MSSDAPNNLPPISESTFYMLRCVVAVACADNVVKQQELILLRTIVSHFKHHAYVSPEQIAQLKLDLKVHQPIELLLPHVTNREDREQLILFAGMIAQAEGNANPAEDAILQKIRAQGPAGQSAEVAAFDAAAAPHANAAAPASAVPVPVPAGGQSVIPPAPKMDMNAFMDEVRQVVRQEVYQQALKTSGIEPRNTGRAAVLDAFAEKSTIVPHNSSYHVVAETPKLGRTMRESLVDGERVLGKARFHRIYAVDTILISFLLIWLARPAAKLWWKLTVFVQANILGNAGSWLGQDNVEKIYTLFQNPWWLRAPVVVLYLAALAYALTRLARWLTTEIVVTDSRIIAKQGIFSIRTFKADFTTLGQADVNQSLLGNLLGYGKVHIFTRNWEGRGSQFEAEGIYLPPIADPHAFSTLIDRARRMWRTRSV